jgi:hypothetical protein
LRADTPLGTFPNTQGGMDEAWVARALQSGSDAGRAETIDELMDVTARQLGR